MSRLQLLPAIIACPQSPMMANAQMIRGQLPAPQRASGRTDHTAVWTGSEMIVWGGLVAAIEHRREIQSQHG